MALNLQGGKFLKASLMVLLVCFSSLAVASPTAYLPIGIDSHLQLQIHRLFFLTSGNPMRLPYAIKDIEQALSKIKQRQPALYQTINSQLNRYRGHKKLSRAGITTRLSAKEDQLIGNQRGLSSDQYLQVGLEAIWRPRANILVQAGMEYREDSAHLVPFNSFIATIGGNLQLDVGYREHWYSPFKFSSQLISSNVKLNPSLSLSAIKPIKKWWHLNFDLFYTRLDRVNKGISYLGEWHDGKPHLLGTHVSIEPINGWKLGFNRMLQFGGGPRNVSFGDILKAFIDPATKDNSYTQDQRKTEFGDQIASVTSSYRFTTGVPMEIYAELAGEDTQGGSNFSLGNQATSFGVYWPKVNQNIDLRYEYNRFKTAWYTNHMFAYGNTNNGRVIGHYAGDQRKFGHGVPTEIHKVSIDLFATIATSWGLSAASINNKDKILYRKGKELELIERHYWRKKRIESKLTYGSSVFSKDYWHFSTVLFW